MTTYRVHVSTDLGGDPDDIQSLYRLIHYSDILNVEGVSSCTGPGSNPSSELIKDWIRRIDVEHLRNQGYTDLISEEKLLSVTKQGPTEPLHSQTKDDQPRAPYDGGNTPGSDHLIKRAKADDPKGKDRPLWVLVWGSITGVAQALYDAPEIAENIRIYFISSTNTQHDPDAREWVYRFMEEYPNLWWIENGRLPKWSSETFRGVYLGGDQSGEWGRKKFIEENIRGRGSTHGGDYDKLCGDAFPSAHADGNQYMNDGQTMDGVLKEGDSPSMLYLLSPVLASVGNVDDPTQPSWGGRFRRPEPDKYPNYYVDLDADLQSCWNTINRWRTDYLSHWKQRWDRYEE